MDCHTRSDLFNPVAIINPDFNILKRETVHKVQPFEIYESLVISHIHYDNFHLKKFTTIVALKLS